MVTSSASSTPVQSIEIFLPSRGSSSTHPVSMLNLQTLSSYFIKCTSTTTIHSMDLDNRTDTTLYRKKFPMNKLLSCRYNMDTNRVEARFEDGTILSIDCIAVEDEYGNTPKQRAELDWLLYNKPLEYSQLVLGGEVEHYLSLGCDHGRMED